MPAPKFITIEQLRYQLNLSPDEGEDGMLELYCSAAEASVINRINRNVYPKISVIPIEDASGIHICDDLILGMLMTAATFWQSRELNSASVQVYKVPMIADLTIDIYRERVL